MEFPSCASRIGAWKVDLQQQNKTQVYSSKWNPNISLKSLKVRLKYFLFLQLFYLKSIVFGSLAAKHNAPLPSITLKKFVLVLNIGNKILE